MEGRGFNREQEGGGGVDKLSSPEMGEGLISGGGA